MVINFMVSGLLQFGVCVDASYLINPSLNHEAMSEVKVNAECKSAGNLQPTGEGHW